MLDVFKTLVFDPLVKSATASIIALAPWLAFPPIAWLVRKVVSYVADLLYGLLSQTINFQVIMLNNEAHMAAYVKSSDTLTKLFDDKGMDSPEFKAAREVHIAALAKFVRNPNS